MTAEQIIKEISTLPPEERAKVTQFARQFQDERALTGAELGNLAERLADAPSAAEADALAEQIVAGFYGERKPA